MNRIIFAAAFTMASFGQATPIVYSIPIQNASFETPIPQQTPPDACGLQLFGIPGWASNGGSLSSVLTTTGNSQCSFSSPVPDGHNVALVEYPHTISQDLGNIYDLLPHNAGGDVVGVLKLTVFIANKFYWYDGAYTVSLSLTQVPTGPPSSNVVLCSTSGIAAGDFTKITIPCPEQRNYGELTLNISANTPDWSIVADKVSLTFTPTQ